MSNKDIHWSGFQWHTDCALVHRVSDPLPTFQGHDILSIKYHENITKLSYTCNGRWITSHIYDPSNGAIFNYHEWPRTSNPGSLKNYAVELVGPQNGWALIHKAALHVGTLYLGHFRYYEQFHHLYLKNTVYIYVQITVVGRYMRAIIYAVVFDWMDCYAMLSATCWW